MGRRNCQFVMHADPEASGTAMADRSLPDNGLGANNHRVLYHTSLQQISLSRLDEKLVKSVMATRTNNKLGN
eukprot:25357-Amphidinium_carterae.1